MKKLYIFATANEFKAVCSYAFRLKEQKLFNLQYQATLAWFKMILSFVLSELAVYCFIAMVRRHKAHAHLHAGMHTHIHIHLTTTYAKIMLIMNLVFN